MCCVMPDPVTSGTALLHVDLLGTFGSSRPIPQGEIRFQICTQFLVILEITDSRAPPSKVTLFQSGEAHSCRIVSSDVELVYEGPS